MASGGQQTQYAQPANYNLSPGTRADGQSSALEVTKEGNLKASLFSGLTAINPNPLGLVAFDYVSRTLAGDNITETWTFKSGGASGTTTNTVVIVYTDTSLNYISTVTKT
jgi:hypothetical protein